MRGIGRFTWALVLLAMLSSSEAQRSKSALTDPLPDNITIHEPGLYPEDVKWDSARQRFLVSSVTHGSVSIVRDDGTLEPFIDGKGIKSSIGIHIDRVRNRLLVAAADFSAVNGAKVKGEAKLAIYDLTTGKRRRLVDLAKLSPQERHLANAVTVDPQGNAYVTDSFAPLIYRVTPAGKVSVFLEDPILSGKGVNLNGIAYHPSGFLLFVVGSQKAIYRVPVGKPGKAVRVRISELVKADNLTLRPNGNLVAGVPSIPGVIELASEDNWRSARVIGRASTVNGATTTGVTLRDAAVYGLNSHFDEMAHKQPVQNFEIFRANLR